MSFLTLEDDIAARLRAKLPGDVHVLIAADLAGVIAGGHPTPAVLIILPEDKPTQTSADGRSARIELTWQIVAAVRNVRDFNSGQAARVDAITLQSLIRSALMGWRVDKNIKPLKNTQSSQSGYNKGFMYIATPFTTEYEIEAGE